MCGPAGSGKSTIARQLEKGGATRLSFDQVAWRRGMRTMPLPPDVHREIEDELRARLRELVNDNAKVVLDFSFWSRRMRDEYRELLRPFGVIPETIYLATPLEVVRERTSARRASHGDDYVLSDELTVTYFEHFEAPTNDEGPLTVVRELMEPVSPALKLCLCPVQCPSFVVSSLPGRFTLLFSRKDCSF